MIRITIPGRPLGKQRPRATIRGKGKEAFIHEYTPDQTVNYEVFVKMLITEKYKNWIPWDKDVSLLMNITAYMAIPESKKKKIAEGDYAPKKPDRDNIDKIIGDAFNQIVYADDSRIVDGRIVKLYSNRPRVEIQIFAVGKRPDELTFDQEEVNLDDI